MPNFTTGPSTLPDVGTLYYNGVTFSPLFETNVSGQIVKDAANRTTKFMEYVITADGFVTLPDGAGDIGDPMETLRKLLTQQAGVLKYTGRGNDIIVNAVGSTFRDVAWGPIPEILEFQPLGGGRSAKIRWQVKTSIPEVAPKAAIGGVGPVLQFNEETSVTYDEAGYSTLSIRGTLEIPLTRVMQESRTSVQTVDDFRQAYMTAVFGRDGSAGIDLTRFRVTRREFRVSRDKRTMEWDFAAEEQPYMPNPAGITVARGTYDVKPATTGIGLVSWNCTLRCTYTVPKGTGLQLNGVSLPAARRTAWVAFLALLRYRMAQSANAVVPPQNAPTVQNQILTQVINYAFFGAAAPPIAGQNPNPPGAAQNILRHSGVNVQRSRNAWLLDFNFSEGLYQDSRTVSFSATWRLVTTFSEILIASGLWMRVPQQSANAWAISVRNISGWTSWTQNRLQANQDVIVDFGG